MGDGPCRTSHASGSCVVTDWREGVDENNPPERAIADLMESLEAVHRAVKLAIDLCGTDQEDAAYDAMHAAADHHEQRLKRLDPILQEWFL